MLSKSILKKKSSILSVLTSLFLALSLVASPSALADPITNVNEIDTYTVGGNPYFNAFSPNGKLLAVGSCGNSLITIYKVGADGSLTLQGSPYYMGYNTCPRQIAFSNDSSLLAVADSSNNGNGYSNISIFEVSENGDLSNQTQSLVTLNTSYLSFSADGGFLLVGRSSDLLSYKINPNLTLTQVNSADTDQGYYSSLGDMSVSPTNSLIAVTYYDTSKVVIFKIDSNGTLSRQSITSTSTGTDGVAFSPDGNFLVVTNQNLNQIPFSENNVSVFQVDSSGNLNNVWSGVAGWRPQSVKFSPDGENVVLGGFSSTLFSFNPDGSLSDEIDIPTGSGQSYLIFSPNGSFISSLNSHEGTVSMFSVSDEPSVTTPPASGSGTATIDVQSSISLTLDDTDDSVLLEGIPGSENVTDTDNQMTYLVKSNNLEGYNVTIQADQEKLLPSDTGTNFDSIPVTLLTIEQPDTDTNGTSAGVQTLSHAASKLLYSQNERSVEEGDSFTSSFSLTEVPFVNADDYSGTVTYTATVN